MISAFKRRFPFFRFFKDRHWTQREFSDLADLDEGNERRRTLLEVGCGVGNFVYPLIEENKNLFVYACDFSPRAVNLVKENGLGKGFLFTI